MKRLTIIFFLAFLKIASFAQDGCHFPMMVVVQDENIPFGAAQTLEARLRSAVTANGMEGGAGFSNFCLFAYATEQSKEIISGLRPLVTMTFNVEVFVGNVYTDEKFAATSITLRGAGQSEEKAYASAFSSLGMTNPTLVSFLKTAKGKIASYYSSQIPSIIRQARSFSIKRDYEDAMCLLSSIPACVSGYDEVEEAMFQTFQEYMDYDCRKKLARARAVWYAGQDRESALIAGAYLAAIDPDAECAGDAKILQKAIGDRIGDDWEFEKEITRGIMDIKRLQIEAVRAIGVAYGENQKAHTFNEHWFVR